MSALTVPQLLIVVLRLGFVVNDKGDHLNNGGSVSGWVIIIVAVIMIIAYFSS